MAAPDQSRNNVILVVGGYGAFGIRAAERLARRSGLTVVIAGRAPDKARRAAATLGPSAAALLSHATVDAAAPNIDALRAIAPAVIVNASGPFQAQDYALARAAIAVGAHYIDLADARTFVTGITALDAQARAANVLVTSGASSVPAVAAAIVDSELHHFQRLDEIHHGITPGNGYDPGDATAASILSGLGKPMPVRAAGHWTTAHGWLGLWRYDFPGLGRRFMTACDVPDIELFPARYPTLETARFSAGLEVAPFQLALWCLAGIARAGILPHPERLAGLLMTMKRAFRFLGSDAGGMFVILSGTGLDGQRLERRVHLVARRNQGPYVPAIASIVLAVKLLSGEVKARGAMPCLGLITLDDFRAEVADLAITVTPTTHSN